MEAARNWFTPAELSDLQRIGVRFVPQEAELIKRHLRRKGDYLPEDPGPAGRDHPRLNQENRETGAADEELRTQINAPPLGIFGRIFDARPRGDQIDGAAAPAVDAGGDPDDDAEVDMDREDTQGASGPGPDPGQTDENVVKPRKDSLLRRTQLFIGSVFLFDLAHALLRHLRQEALSLTANGGEADDAILHQLARNVRGMTFVKLRQTSQQPPAGAQPQMQPGQFLIKEAGGDAARVYETPPATSMSDYTDLLGPFSSTELTQLRNKGYVAYEGEFYTPKRIPQWLGSTIREQRAGWGDWFRFSSSDLYANPLRMQALRSQGIYPTTFLTNGMLADDTCAARLIEHINSGTVYTEFFSWEIRKLVFIPLELDVLDITRFGDMERYDRLHARLNAFGTGMYQNMNLAGLWPALREDYSNLIRDVPRNMLLPFRNVAKVIQLPPSPTQPRRTFATEEILNLYRAADDVLRILHEWQRNSGRMNEVTFVDYLNPKEGAYKDIVGNRPEITAYGQAAFNVPECGEGEEAVAFTANPNVPGSRATQVPLWLYEDGRKVRNPLARHVTCAQHVDNLGELPLGDAAVVGDREYRVQRRQARQKRARKKSSRTKKR